MGKNMSDENYNNPIWKNRLEEIENLGEFIGIDKNALWPRLHDRLNNKSKRKKMIWIWAAAACLLFAIIVPFFNAKHKEIQKAGNEVVNKYPDTISTNEVASKSTNTTLKEEINSTERKYKVKKVIEDSKTELIVNNIVKTHSDSNNVKIIKEDVVQVENSYPPAVTKPAETATNVLIAKTKLKVVHINELTTPVQESNQLEVFNGYHFLQINPVNQLIYSNPTRTASVININLFKPKRNSSN